MQRGLVDDGASENGCAVALVGEAHPVEPGGPSRGEVPLEADFVTSRRMMVVSSCVWLAHGAPSFVAWSHSRQRCGEAASPHVMIHVVIPPRTVSGLGERCAPPGASRCSARSSLRAPSRPHPPLKARALRGSNHFPGVRPWSDEVVAGSCCYDKRSSSAARRTAARRLFTPSLV